MAMLFYLPRLFVYHREHSQKADFVSVVEIQEYKLYKYIGTPAMWATILSGVLMLAFNPVLFKSGAWLYIKIVFVALLIAYHFSLEYFRRAFVENPNIKSGKFFRFYNEIPTLLAIVIVIMVVIKPF
jgi:putative membrane protein